MIISFITSFSECFKNKVFKSFSKSFFLSLEIDFKTKVIILMAESNECLLLPLKLILGSNAIPFGVIKSNNTPPCGYANKNYSIS